MAESSPEQAEPVESYSYTELFERARQVQKEFSGMLCTSVEEVAEKCAPYMRELNEVTQRLSSETPPTMVVSGSGATIERFIVEDNGVKPADSEVLGLYAHEATFVSFLHKYKVCNEDSLMAEYIPELYMRLTTGTLRAQVGEFNLVPLSVNILARMDGSADLQDREEIRQQRLEDYTEILELMEDTEMEKKFSWLVNFAEKISEEFQNTKNVNTWTEMSSVESFREIGRITNEMLRSEAFKSPKRREALIGVLNELICMKNRSIRLTTEKFNTVELTQDDGWHVKTQSGSKTVIQGAVEEYLEFTDRLSGADEGNEDSKAVLVVRTSLNSGETKFTYVDLEDISSVRI